MREIGDYAIIGDCRSAALISRDGSLDWLCWPRFDSASVFAALLDGDVGGHFAIHPAAAFTARRRYIENTNILETTFETAGGIARLTDVMSVAPEPLRRQALQPEHEILRRIECVSGEVQMLLRYEPRPEFGCRAAHLRTHGRLGLYLQRHAQLLCLRSDVPLEIVAGRTAAIARFVVREGERRYASLVFSDGEPAVLTPLGDAAEQRLVDSATWWRTWAARCQYEGPYRAAVVRSALVLKLLTFAPSGAVIAAPTTSLPEKLGGVRNWDYRYCWLRDSSLTLQALHDLGYAVEAQAYLSWLLHTTRITWPQLRVMYDVYGGQHLPERELRHLAGFGGSRPVRIGNAATGQLQLDVYGEVLDAVYQFTRRGGRLDRVTARMVAGFGDTVCDCWRLPDEGIWEKRGGRRHHTFSKAMCWVALDRLVKLHDEGEVNTPRDRLSSVRDEIRRDIEVHGFNEGLGTYVAEFGSEDVDASLLQLARYGYVDAHSARMRGTVEAIRTRLGRDGLIYRYLDHRDGLPPGEGAFGICGFWAVDALARMGDIGEASAAYEHLLSYTNDVGLFGEEIDPDTGAALGNFPQAFTHVGLIDAALTLAQSEAST